MTCDHAWEHQPQTITKINNSTIYWNCGILTDRTINCNKPDIIVRDNNVTDKVIKARRPDIVLKEKECLIIDIAIPGDRRAWRKEEEKIQKYNDLAWELRRIWKVKTKVVPIVIGALGTVTTRHRSFLAVLGVEVSFETIQKVVAMEVAAKGCKRRMEYLQGRTRCRHTRESRLHHEMWRVYLASQVHP
nr:uncharacterized protein LOC129275996 [Lytechinus pictus]